MLLLTCAFLDASKVASSLPSVDASGGLAVADVGGGEDSRCVWVWGARDESKCQRDTLQILQQALSNSESMLNELAVGIEKERSGDVDWLPVILRMAFRLSEQNTSVSTYLGRDDNYPSYAAWKRYTSLLFDRGSERLFRSLSKTENRCSMG